MKCPLCHRENRDDARYCDGCGALLYEHSYASNNVQDESQVEDLEQNARSRSCDTSQPAQAPHTFDAHTSRVSDTQEHEHASHIESSNTDVFSAPVTTVDDANSTSAACSSHVPHNEADSSDTSPEHPHEHIQSADQAQTSTPSSDKVREASTPHVASDAQLTQKIDLSGLTESGYGFQDFTDDNVSTRRVADITQPRFATGGETMQMPAIHTDEVSETKEYIAENTVHKRALLSAGTKRALLISAVLVPVMLCVVTITYAMSLWGGKPIPDVSGKTPDVAAEIVKDAGFEVAFADEFSDDAHDVVLRSDPAASKRLEKGSVVTLVVARARIVPDVKGLSQHEAEQQLSSYGYTAIRVESIPSDEEEGSVIKQHPDANTQLPADGAITLTLAAPYVVPDVVNKSVEEASDVLKTAGYKYDISYTYTDAPEKEHVVSSDPAAGEKLHSGGVVTLKAVKYRGTELVALAKQQLKSGSTIKLGGIPYKINEVRQVTYSGANKVKANVAAQPYATILGESVFLKSRDVTLTLSFDAHNKLLSVS